MIWKLRLARVLLGLSLIAAGLGKHLADHAVRLAPVIVGGASGPVMLASTVVEDAVPALEIVTGIAFVAGIGWMSRTLLGLSLGTSFLLVALLMPPGVRCACMGIFGGFESRAAHIEEGEPEHNPDREHERQIHEQIKEHEPRP